MPSGTGIPDYIKLAGHLAALRTAENYSAMSSSSIPQSYNPSPAAPRQRKLNQLQRTHWQQLWDWLACEPRAGLLVRPPILALKLRSVRWMASRCQRRRSCWRQPKPWRHRLRAETAVPMLAVLALQGWAPQPGSAACCLQDCTLAVGVSLKGSQSRHCQSL